MALRTPLYEQHLAAGARMVDFGGWDMPLHYGSQLQEHEVVRQAAGVFDVSHMQVVDVAGPDATLFLRWVLANDVARLGLNGKALYSAMLNPEGGVVDDLIVYRMDPGYRLVVNAGTAEKDWAHLQRLVQTFDVTLRRRQDLAMLAVQGPNARALVAQVRPEWAATVQNLLVFQGLAVADAFIGRTGYTGEDGVELMLPAAQAPALWQDLLAAGVRPIGLGARDTLRLEAGMNLYGQDMDEQSSPLICGLGWTIAWAPEDRQFVGRAPIEAEHKQGPTQKLVGLVLEGAGVLRAGYVVLTSAGAGVTTSGTFSPSLKQSIALARVPSAASGPCQVLIRGQAQAARMVRPQFVRHGQPVLQHLG